ncbi:hypothetical protein SAMN05421842_12956 [Clostridium uliginosum]|uniref:Uncharacterized protein n=1 Tax=Clostridium uliginosum TaxID=119641 RepID=A0A1I1R3C6_9CLOT|nr:hypothetical protein SAMN05421842_12956 [Clostridium uliginosum]
MEGLSLLITVSQEKSWKDIINEQLCKIEHILNYTKEER